MQMKSKSKSDRGGEASVVFEKEGSHNAVNERTEEEEEEKKRE